MGEKIPFAIANDGDVAALAGSLSHKARNVVGISMGTSEAGGYVDGAGYDYWAAENLHFAFSIFV